MAKYIMSIDQGTTGTTVSLFEKNGRALVKVNEEFPQLYPQSGWVEHNPEDIWASVVSTIAKALAQAGAQGSDVAAIGITNQRETALIWDRQSGKAIHNAVVWQCRRTSDFCDKLKKKGHEPFIYKKTGLVIDPYFSASKFRWILDHVKGSKARAKAGELAAGTIDSFLLWRLTSGEVHKTDVTNASRTQLMNIETLKWDKELLKLFSVPEEMLPEVAPSSGVFGVTSGVHGLPDGIPIAGVAGDQQAALFGQTCFEPGLAKCTFGTGSFILMNTGKQLVSSKWGLLSTVAWQLSDDKPPVYALEGGAFICGAAVQWLRDGLELIRQSSEIEPLAAQVSDSGGVQLVPAFTGLGAPYWDSAARGILTGLSRGTSKAHVARAALEAMALQNADILVAMEKDLGRKLKSLRVDGGASANDLLMQMQSDYLGVPTDRPSMIETTSAGAAYLAGLGIGFWSDLEEIRQIWQVDRTFKPQVKPAKRKARLQQWQEAVAQAMYKGGLEGLKPAAQPVKKKRAAKKASNKTKVTKKVAAKKKSKKKSQARKTKATRKKGRR